jgi:hypothetical protein
MRCQAQDSDGGLRVVSAVQGGRCVFTPSIVLLTHAMKCTYVA